MANLDTKPTTDPTFALLDAHRKAEHAYFAFPDTNGDKTLELQFSELGDELYELGWDLARCQPTTIAGVAAVLEYVAEADRWDDPLAQGAHALVLAAAWETTLHRSLARALERIARR